LASAVLNRDGDIYTGCRRLLNGQKLTKWVFELGKHGVPPERYADAYLEIDVGSFVGFLVSRETIEKVGFPKREFFIYFDDVEYSLRIRRVGRILTVPDSKVVHKAASHSSIMVLRGAFYFHRNRIYTCRLHGSPDSSFYIRASVSALRETLFLAWALFPMSLRILKRILKRRQT
jgi:GT2 family glycosyltransferase